MSDRIDPSEPIEMVTVTDAEKSARRRRNIAIAICLFGMVAMFYVATIAKFGPGIIDRPPMVLGN